jgi:hypothetical protein
VPYNRLLTLCEELNNILLLDEYDAVYYVLTCLLIDLGADSLMWDKLSTTDLWLEHLDPEQQGMTITVDGANETWPLGETVVFERNGESWAFSLPDYEDYVFGFTHTVQEDSREWRLEILCEDMVWLDTTFTVDGLLDPLNASGTATLEITGDALWLEIPVLAFQYDYCRTADILPYDLKLNVDWLHPETQEPALGCTYEANMDELIYAEVYNRPIDHQDDFFHLNESLMSEYADRFLPTLVAAFAPFALEVPAGVLSDLMQWMDDLGILAFLGLE